MFDPLWKRAGVFEGGTPSVRRTQAYAWLGRTLNTDKYKTHFGMFDAAQCRTAIEAMEKLIAERTGDNP